MQLFGHLDWVMLKYKMDIPSQYIERLAAEAKRRQYRNRERR